MNQIFLECLFTTVDPTTRKYAFPALASFYLPHYKCPERHLHNEILEKCWYQTQSFAMLILSVTFAPLTGFHATKRRDISRVSIPSGLSCATKIQVPPIADLFQITQFNFRRGLLVAICVFFFSCCFCKVIMLAWARVACVSSRARGQTKSRVQISAWPAMFTEAWLQRILSTLAFDINSSSVHAKYIRWCEYLASSNLRREFNGH